MSANSSHHDLFRDDYRNCEARAVISSRWSKRLTSWPVADMGAVMSFIHPVSLEG
ncbi:MAG: hypothetical protein AAF468_17410 [Pseudomonadota bacterium]